jgi:hypothetical protein
MEKQTIALFDFDIIAYRAAAAVEERTVAVTHIPTNKTKVFKTRTEFKKFLSDKNYPFVDSDYEFTDIQTPEPVENACQIVKKQVNTIKQEVQADYIAGYVGVGSTNFRLKLDLPEPYKGQRENMLRPIHLDEAKKYALKKFPGELVEDVEADDYLVIKYHEYKQAGHDPVIITLDKDQKGCVGTKYYDWTQPDAKIIEVPAFGYLTYIDEKKKIDGVGLNFYCYQMLCGDNADNYGPSDLHKKKFGDKSALKVLEQLETIDQLFGAVEKQYKEWFPDPVTYKTQTGFIVTKNYRDLLELYHQAAYMKRTKDDKTGFYDLWEEFK